MPDKNSSMSAEPDRRNRFEQLFAAHRAAVHAYALRRCEPHVAQDVVAETFLIAWRRLDDVSEEELPWLYGVARRVLANELRGARRRGALADRAAAAVDCEKPEGASGESPILRALARLPERDRELLLLVAWEGLRPGEAASALGCSRPAARVRLHRARKRLETALEQSGEHLRPLTSLEESP